ncbi:hypothetical protein [Stenotrophomonas maltophilia]|uniref:hypothetical protein n=1 Tax=Stenotrophomonas maltophilia TaxID=40324 RepID=UPI003BF87347
MATLAELERALVAADAAGNTEDARALAQAIAAQRQPKAQPTQERTPRATDTMSGLDRFRAGIGKSLVDTGTGLAQVALRNITPQIPEFITRAGDRVEQAIGSPTYSNARRAVFGAYNAPRQGLERKVAERREIDKDLMDTGAGLAGNVVGTLAQLAAPGIAARGTATAPLLLPTSVRGSVAQGAVFGSAQPVASQGEVLGNAGIGAGGGLLGAAIPAAAGRAVQAVKQVGAPFTQRGTEEAAARVIRGFAEDPARLVRNPSSVPGVQRTLAEETLDPGIAQLQRAVSAREGAAFDSLRRGNNAARVGAIRQFAGDEADIAAAEAARDAAAVPLLQRAETVTGVDTQPVRDYVQQAIDANATRPTVRNAVRDVQAALNEAGDDVSSLYNLRKYIDDLLQGRVGGEQGYARAASRELQGVKGALDQQLESASPEFGQYLDLYRSGSAPINRMQAGQELLRRSSGGIADPTTGLEVLTPAAFGRSARNLDAIAASGTGFGKASAANVFQPSDLATIRGVNDDLARQAFADTAGRGSGSDTFQKLATNGDILGAVQELGVNIPGSGVIRMLGSAGRDRVNRQLVEILTDPARAQDVLRRTSASDRKVIQGVLTAMGGESGTALAVGSSN